MVYEYLAHAGIVSKMVASIRLDGALVASANTLRILVSGETGVSF